MFLLPEVKLHGQVLQVSKLAVGLKIGELKELNTVITKYRKHRVGDQQAGERGREGEGWKGGKE